MVEWGMLVWMEEGRDGGILREIFIDIGDEESIEEEVSRYCWDVRKMKMMVK